MRTWLIVRKNFGHDAFSLLYASRAARGAVAGGTKQAPLSRDRRSIRGFEIAGARDAACGRVNACVAGRHKGAAAAAGTRTFKLLPQILGAGDESHGHGSWEVRG